MAAPDTIFDTFPESIAPDDARLPVVVIGAGPVGLAAAGHLAERGLSFVVFEAGASVASNIASWGHVRLFTPWRYLTDPAAIRLISQNGWEAPDPDLLPTGREFIDTYLQPLASALSPFVRLESRVVAITRLGTDKVKSRGRDASPFVVRVASADGRVEEHLARAVIDASGTWTSPNPIGAGGIPAIGEVELGRRVRYGIPDIMGRDRPDYENRTTLVVGAGHSAANTILDLLTLAKQAPETRAIWAVRGSSLAKSFGGGAADELPARGQLGIRLREAVDGGLLAVKTAFKIVRLEEAAGGRVRVVAADTNSVVVDRVVGATGQRPDLSLARELRVDLDPWLESPRQLAPLIDPNIHHCGSVRPHGYDVLSHPEAGYFVAGVKSYGRAPTFLTMTGYEQVRSVVAALAGDLAAARRLELTLPETGVCITDYDAGTDEPRGLVPEPALVATGSTQRNRATASAVDVAGCCGASVDEPVLVAAGSAQAGAAVAPDRPTASGNCCG